MVLGAIYQNKLLRRDYRCPPYIRLKAQDEHDYCGKQRRVKKCNFTKYIPYSEIGLLSGQQKPLFLAFPFKCLDHYLSLMTSKRCFIL